MILRSETDDAIFFINNKFLARFYMKFVTDFFWDTYAIILGDVSVNHS